MTRAITSAHLALLLAAVPAGAGIFCSEPGIAIPDNNLVGVSDSLVISHPESLRDLDVWLEVPHTWVGDLVIELRYEDSSQEVTLVDRPRHPELLAGCSGDDLILRLDDDASATAENDCIPEGDPAFPLGIYQAGDPPAAVLAAFDDQPLEGTWTLTVADANAEDVGTLERWCLIAPTRVATLGGEFQVNSYTTSSQDEPEVAIASGGDFVVVWRSYGQDGSYWSVQGQRFASDGTTLGGEFQVNSYTTSSQVEPAVAVAPGGDFVVVWNSYGPDGSGSSVQGQRFASDGTFLGGEFQVNSYTTSVQDEPAVAVASSGDFVAVWGSFGPDGSGFSVQGQRYASDGTTLGGEFQVNSYTTSSQSHPAVAIAPGGDFVVVWESVQDGSDFSVQGQRFASDGTALGGEFQVNSYTTNSQFYPAVAIAPGGDFVVVWNSYGQDGSYWSVQGQRFASDGTTLGGEFQINSYTTSDQFDPAVAIAPGGDFVVVWHSYGQDGSYFSVQGQRFASDGTTLGGEFQVNAYTTDFQRYPAVAIAPGGDFVVVWQSYGQDGSHNSVQGQRFGDPCVTGACIFVDGFESGDTTAWSSSVP